jgi:putative restriction endonuclease
MAPNKKSAQRWKDSVSCLNTWKRGGQRAVHKPLLTLILLARADSGGSARLNFTEIEEPLTALLREFGPPRKALHPEFPFWHLQSDGYWKVEDAKSFKPKKGGSSPKKADLRKLNAVGYVPEQLWKTLTGQQSLRGEQTNILLDGFWPETLHEAIRQAVGLPDREVIGIPAKRRQRDPAFRYTVLRAYEHRCAVCGYDGRLGSVDLALEAAHIRWHAEDGPDEVSNALALCSFHHVALDRGALGLTEDYRCQVSEHVHGGPAVEEWLLRFSGQNLRAPQLGHAKPGLSHLRWHLREVFRPPARTFG